MRIGIGLLVGLLGSIGGAAHADLHVVSEVDTGATGKIIVEQWLSSNRSYRGQGQIAYLADLQRKELLLVDHERRRVTRYELVDPKPLGAFQFEITLTGERGRVGPWAAEEFKVANLAQPGVEYRVWTTREIDAETQHYFNFVRRLPGGGALAASLQQLEGFPVRIVTLIRGPAGDQRVVSEVIKIDNAHPPRGIYEAPEGYVEK